jgi:hypothetical protein
VTKGLNHLVFVPHLLANDDFPWICHWQVAYIPNVPLSATPSDHSPLNMLDVLY